MYESFFGLTDRPFAAMPAAGRYFQAAAIENARGTLARCIDRAEGIGLAIGPAGTGKSMLCQVLAEQFRGRFDVALLASGRIDSPRALFQAILFELGLPRIGLDEGELRLALADRLTVQEPQNDGLLLLVDEAQTLPLRMLDELRLVMNMARNGQPRVRLVLAGSPSLEQRLASPKLESFNQRITARCYLQSFTRDETLAFVRHEIARAGGDADRIFTADALDAIRRATDGVPRLINQLCDHALLLAFTGGVRQLNAAAIEEAWADLQQLPTPWNAAPGAAEHSADIIEFGSLDEPSHANKPAGESTAAPRLRTVVPEDEESLTAGEPFERIGRIEEQLDTIDAGFRPLSTIRPEVELVFPAADNPFQESFAEEEVVVDRFAAMRSDALAGAPVVRSAEGRELAEQLAPWTSRQPAEPPQVDAPRAEPPPAPPADTDDVVMPERNLDAADEWIANSSNERLISFPATPSDDPSANEISAGESRDSVAPDDHRATIGFFNPADDPVLPDVTSREEPPGADPFANEPTPIKAVHELHLPKPQPAAIVERTDPSPIPVRPPFEFHSEPNEPELIVVEDDPPLTAPTTIVTLPVASPSADPPPRGPRKSEYRQLFAKLRKP